MQKETQEKSKEKEKYRYGMITIPHVKGLSKETRREMKEFEIPVSFKPYKTIGQHLGHPKDPILKEEQSGVVYTIKCKDCEGKYIGETGRQMRLELKNMRWM